MRAATTVPAWLVALTLPIWLAIAAALGLAEHHYIVAQVAQLSAAAAVGLENGSNLPPGGMLAGVGLAAADVVLVGVAFNTLLTGLVHFRHGEALFPWVYLASVVATLVFCFACASTLGGRHGLDARAGHAALAAGQR